ncbi:MAG: diguanylate cyclase, partial [Solirubrobacteraceae bacterium]|nr:diguanylate cyclase [Solirubrobacteraceae bacterium]
MEFVDVNRGETRPPDRRLRQGRRRTDAPLDRILGRRDVAIVPWLSMLAGALAIALSFWLRGLEGATNEAAVIVALGGAAVAAGFAAIQDSWLGLRFRGSLWVYVIVSATLLSALATLAVTDGGLATPIYSASYLLASYLGLVFPRRWRRVGLVVLLATAAGVQAANPVTPIFDAVMIAGLTVAAWIVGVIGSRAHHWAARVAGALGSYDELTGLLNRRGLLLQVDRLLAPAQRDAGPIALMIVDLDGFKAVNDEYGHAAGDELLAWVGRALPTGLPMDAEVGRLGGDEFAVVLPGVNAVSAAKLGRSLRDALSPRIVASVGIATSESRSVVAHDLFRVADAALYQCKRDRTLGTQALVAGSAGRIERRRGRPAEPAKPPLSFARMRATGFAPKVPEPGLTYGWIVTQGLLVIAAAGAYVVAGVLLTDGSGLWHALMTYLGIPWVALTVGLALLSVGRGVITDGWRFWTILLGGDALLVIGVGVAMLDNGGLVAPIGGALFLKLQFMAAILPPRHSRVTLVSMSLTAVLVAVLGPASSLWVAPFYVAMLGAAYGLGSIGYRALDDLTTAAMEQAHTDELTGLRNRSGFGEVAGETLQAASAAGTPLAVLALDLDDFKGINDERGHA